MSFHGDETWEISYPINTPTIVYSVPISRCVVKSKSVSEKFEIYDVEKKLYMEKWGNRWTFDITIVSTISVKIQQSDIDTLEQLNGQLVNFRPHTDNVEEYECWLWYYYDDTTPHKDKIHINLTRKDI